MPEEIKTEKKNNGGEGRPFGLCRNCKKPMNKKRDSCRCRPWLCHSCCECGLDCDLCGCSHRVEK